MLWRRFLVRSDTADPNEGAQ